ncbi:acyltransferase [Duganella caerulea]|uniref:acyltransferase family protein n=1 Tax=Duganella caerulea TaxID=2885762 RepID=UPI0030E844A1
MLRSLQIGRALATISVVVFHLSLTMELPQYGNNPVFREYTQYGNSGVDFFFVLSGFIIMFAHHQDIGRPEAWTRFCFRRFVRLFPIYWLYTACLVAMLYLGVGGKTILPTDWQGWVSSLLLIRFDDVSPPLPVAWTLFHEVAFYAVFSLLILNKRLGIAVAVACLALSVCFFQFPSEFERTPFKVYTSGYSFHFLFGIGAYWLYRKGGTGRMELFLGVLSLLVAFSALTPWRDLQHLGMALGFGFLLAAAVKFEQAGHLKFPRVLGAIGDASYTIYLTHSKILGAFMALATATGLQAKIGGELVFVLALLTALVCGYLAYWLIERRVLSLRSWFGGRRRSPVLAPT